MGEAGGLLCWGPSGASRAGIASTFPSIGVLRVHGHCWSQSLSSRFFSSQVMCGTNQKLPKKKKKKKMSLKRGRSHFISPVPEDCDVTADVPSVNKD